MCRKQRNRIFEMILLLSLIPGMVHASPPSFTISNGRFLEAGQEVFLNVLSYQPLEPGQTISEGSRAPGIADDLRRFCAFEGGSDPVVLRVYAQPTAALPVRMPRSFYDGVRQLDFWILRDIFFDGTFDPASGRSKIDAVLAEIASVEAHDRIFAWEFGDEFDGAHSSTVEDFLCEMLEYLKGELATLEAQGTTVSQWVTWNAFPPTDPLRTDGNPVSLEACSVDFDFYSINAYSYEPDRLRDHQGGIATGTPYAGYLAALKEKIGGRPVVVSETGLADSPTADAVHLSKNYEPHYPAYRKGGISGEQVAEGLADRYWDARLAGVAGISYFEYNDEWHKSGDPGTQGAAQPEEHFGLVGFANYDPLSGASEARNKLPFHTVADLFRRRFEVDPPLLSGVTPASASIPCTGSTALQVTGAGPGLRFRWETNRGLIVGDGVMVEFHAGGISLGPATVTVVASDAAGGATLASTTVAIEPCGAGPAIEVLTLGAEMASGRVADVDLDQFKVVAYIETDSLFVQPFADMKSIWIRPDGYFWTQVHNLFQGTLRLWLVPHAFDPPASENSSWEPPGQIATAALATENDLDDDLLPDDWETTHFGGTVAQNRDGDPDLDGVVNLEEWLRGKLPFTADNDADGDDLEDDWEGRFFGSITARAGSDDPEGDGLDNSAEQAGGLHPGRTAIDRDGDALPDLWEFEVLGDLAQGGGDLFPSGGMTNIEAYREGSAIFCRRLFTDGFESGDMSRWSLAVGN